MQIFEKCPYCLSNQIAQAQKEITITYQGERVTFLDEYFKCKDCKQEWVTSELYGRNYQRLKEEYNKIRGI